MSSVEDFDFLSGDAEASWTHPVKASSVRKGGYVMLRGFPCKIVELSTAQPGKHGHSKVHFIGLDVFTGKKYEDISPAKDTVEVPNIVRCEYQLISVTDRYLELMDQAGKLRQDVHLPRGALRDEVSSRWEEGEDLLVTVLSGMGQSVVLSVRAAPNN